MSGVQNEPGLYSKSLSHKQTKTKRKKKRRPEIGQCPMSKKERGVVSGIAVGCSVC